MHESVCYLKDVWVYLQRALIYRNMTWSTFQCDDPDFFVRSMRDDPPVQFGVLRKALSDSEVFREWHTSVLLPLGCPLTTSHVHL